MKDGNYYRNGIEFIHSMENEEKGVFIIVEDVTGTIISEDYFSTYSEAWAEVVAQECAGYWQVIELVKAGK